MAVVKKTWDELLQKNNKMTNLFDNMSTLATAVDTAFNTKYNASTHVADVLSDIKTDYLTVGSGLWKELEIFMSSFKEEDKRPYRTIQDKLTRYLVFFAKMITDDGLARSLITQRNFANNNHSGSTDKNYYSETPQIELSNFEEGIKYASNLGKNESIMNSSQSGASGETVKSKSWDEELKNLRFAFYNDLVDFIVDLPNTLYNYYALDSRPAMSLIKASYDYRKNLVKNKIL